MPSLRYSSHDIVLETQTYTISVAGEQRRPEPKVFELLSYLMRNPGRVVPKEELLDALWSSEVVGESVLTRCVSCARKLIQDDPRAPKFVRTAHGRGYEFVAPVAAETLRTPSGAPRADAANGNLVAEPSTPRGERPFVGRNAELQKLDEALRNLRSERHKVILVSGEAGIGKTRLLEEVIDRAGVAEAHFCRATSADGAPPFFVWQQCFRSIAKSRSMKVVLRALGDASGGTRKLLLGMDRFTTDEAVGWDSPAARFRAFDAILRSLTDLARQRDLVLVFDDLHNADLGSLLLLAFVAEQARGPILVLGTLRDGEPVDAARRAVLARLRSTLGGDVPLGGLSRSEVSQFLGGTSGADHEALVQRLFTRSGGNPFFLSLLAPASGAPDSQRALPTAVRQAVLGRLATLPGRSATLLKLAAVFGTDFGSVLLSRASGIPESECADVLEAASDAHIVVQSKDNRFGFAHDLIREVLYAELSAEEMSFNHFQVGSALETLPEYREARHAATLARHMVLAAGHAGATRSLDLSIRAGAHALRNFAYEEAVEHFSRARDLLPVCTDIDPATECAVLLDLGLSQVSAGQREQAKSTLHRAAEKARSLDASEGLAQVALSLAPGLFAIETGVYDPVLVELLREALAQVGVTNGKLRALLLGRLALALYWSDTFEERKRLCEDAKQLAESSGATDVLSAVTTARAFALLRPSNLDERRRLSEAAIDFSQRAGERQLLMLNRLLLRAIELERGDMAAAAFEADAFRALAEETRQPQSLWIVQAQRASVLLMDGRLEEVEALAGECLVVGQRVRDHNALLTFGVHLTLVRIEQGRASEVLDAIRDYAARYPLIVGWRVLHARALASAGDTRAAEAEYRSLKARDLVLPNDLNWMVSMAWLSELCHLLGDQAAAEILYERLAPYADRLVIIGYGIACLGSVERYLGLLSLARGHHDAARRHFEAAIEVNRRVSATLPLAHALHDLGAMLSNSENGTDARTYVDEAQSLAQSRNLTALSRTIRTP